MNNILKFLVCLSLCLQSGFAVESDNTEKHLLNYSSLNNTAHDNIDDTVEDHSHRHRHSENGEEHEHKHSHAEISYSQFKVFYSEQTININFNVTKSNILFAYKSHHSSPPTFCIFRPPIS